MIASRALFGLICMVCGVFQLASANPLISISHERRDTTLTSSNLLQAVLNNVFPTDETLVSSSSYSSIFESYSNNDDDQVFLVEQLLSQSNYPTMATKGLSALDSSTGLSKSTLIIIICSASAAVIVITVLLVSLVICHKQKNRKRIYNQDFAKHSSNSSRYHKAHRSSGINNTSNQHSMDTTFAKPKTFSSIKVLSEPMASTTDTFVSASAPVFRSSMKPSAPSAEPLFYPLAKREARSTTVSGIFRMYEYRDHR